jgi:hypothetical protein
MKFPTRSFESNNVFVQTKFEEKVPGFTKADLFIDSV